MKKLSRVILSLAAICSLRACAITDSERAILDDAAQRALNKGLDRLGPAISAHPVK